LFFDCRIQADITLRSENREAHRSQVQGLLNAESISPAVLLPRPNVKTCEIYYWNSLRYQSCWISHCEFWWAILFLKHACNLPWYGLFCCFEESITKQICIKEKRCANVNNLLLLFIIIVLSGVRISCVG